ncbi:MAG: T9SS type A sorting domain-containing protein [Bacteroidia bacterium]|nr:T9SS type A sorting domain-containing protein [Bacteroidia bacterium]
MKKIITLIVLTIIINCARGQNYFPLPLDSTIIWRVDFNGQDASNACPSCNIPYQYITNGDTIIHSILYTKIKATGWYNCANWSCGFGVQGGYRGAIREDTIEKKIYFILANDTIEKTLYDFTQNVGDTVNSVLSGFLGPFIIESIDSILIGTLYHKRFNLNYIYTSLIEGIGSTSGLLDQLGGGIGFGSTLICVSHFNQTIYPNSTTSCDMVNINDIEFIKSTVSPNPFNESFEIKLSKPFGNTELIIYDLLSRQQFKKNYNRMESIKVVRNNLPNGIYFYQLVSENKVIATGKIIAE